MAGTLWLVAGIGVSGISKTGSGVNGSSNSGSGVVGVSESGLAGQFNGNVQVNGNAAIEGVLSVTSTANLAFVVNGNARIEGTVACQSTNSQLGVLGRCWVLLFRESLRLG